MATEWDSMLFESWATFCDDIKAAGTLLLRDTTPATALDRAEGFRYLAQRVTQSLFACVENSDPRYPMLAHTLGPTQKAGGDSPDATYLSAPIDGVHSYRVSGDMGTAHYVSFSLHRSREAVAKGADIFADFRLKRDIKRDWDGHFEMILSPDDPPPGFDGNWMKTTHDTDNLMIRQYFADWENDRPMTVWIERIGATAPPPPLAPERVAQAFREAGERVTWVIELFASQMNHQKANSLNTFIPYWAERQVSNAPGGVVVVGYWSLNDDEALVIEFRPPECPYWNIQVSNYWWQSFDYRYHRAGSNNQQAVLETDGTVRFVIAHADPGVPNWLETAGHREGCAAIRFIDAGYTSADEAPIPATRVVKLSELAATLPPDAKRSDPTERRQASSGFPAAIARRFRT